MAATSLAVLRKPLAGAALGFRDAGGSHPFGRHGAVPAAFFIAVRCRRFEPHMGLDIVVALVCGPALIETRPCRRGEPEWEKGGE